jgi:hypothetical protein
MVGWSQYGIRSDWKTCVLGTTTGAAVVCRFSRSWNCVSDSRSSGLEAGIGAVFFLKAPMASARDQRTNNVTENASYSHAQDENLHILTPICLKLNVPSNALVSKSMLFLWSVIAMPSAGRSVGKSPGRRDRATPPARPPSLARQAQASRERLLGLVAASCGAFWPPPKSHDSSSSPSWQECTMTGCRTTEAVTSNGWASACLTFCKPDRY